MYSRWKRVGRSEARSWTSSVVWVALVFLVAAFGVESASADSDASTKQAKRLSAQADEILETLAARRGLRLLRPVPKGVKDRAALRSYILESFAKEMPDAEIEDMRRAYVKLGFIPAGLDLKRILVDLYAEQVAGFYDPEKKELFLIGNAPSDEQKMVMAHELVHALQDQHFDLLPLQRAIEDNDDRTLAITALVEGDATVAMFDYMLNEQTGGALDVRSLPDLGRTVRVMNSIGEILGAKQETLARAPKVLTENLMFGYVEGASFSHRLVKRGGYEAVDRAFWDPPTSSEQILHPEKYLEAPRDEPIEVRLPSVAAALGAGWRTLMRNVVGELNTRILFGGTLPEAVAQNAAAGWGGDAIEVLEGPAGDVVVVWLWVGDSERDAEEFAKAYELFAARRADGASRSVVRDGKKVLVIDGAGATLERRIRRALTGRVELRRGYDTTPGPELLSSPWVPQDWIVSHSEAGKREWKTPDGKARLVFESGQRSKQAAKRSETVAPRRRWSIASRRTEEGAFEDRLRLDTANGRWYRLRLISTDAASRVEAKRALAEHNPRLARWIDELQKQRRVGGQSAPPAYPRRVF